MVTRVTNSMLTRGLLSNLSMNLNNYDKLQNQLASGRKYAHISDDPSALIYGQAARNKLARLSHFQNTVGTAQNWLTQVEAGVMELQKMVGNVYEELINAGGPKTLEDRKNIGMTVQQLRDHYLDTLNASYGDRFIFGGYNTPGDYIDPNNPEIKPFTMSNDVPPNLLFNGLNVSQFDGMPAEYLLVDSSRFETEQHVIDWLAGNPGTPPYVPPLPASPGNPPVNAYGDTISTEDLYKFYKLRGDVLSFDVGPGVSMPVTLSGLDVLFFQTQNPEDGTPIMRNMMSVLDEVYGAINGTDPRTGEPVSDPMSVLDGSEIEGLTMLIRLLQDGQNHLLVKTAEIGGRDRRLELLELRYGADEINYESMRSDAEDADIAEVIMYMRMAETVYQAALSAGARIIQPSLMDFLR